MAYGSIDIVVHMYGTISLDDDGDDDSGHLLGDLTAGSPHNVTITGTGEHTGNIYFNGNTEEQMKRRYFRYNLKIGNPEIPNAIMRGNIYIRYGTRGCGYGAGGLLNIYGDMYGSVQIGDEILGDNGPNEDNAYTTIYIAKSLYNNITVVGDLGKKSFLYMSGLIEIGEDFTPPEGSSAIPTIDIGRRIVGNMHNTARRAGRGP